MLKRIISLATNSLKILNDGMLASEDVHLLGSIMQTSLSPYDAIINLHQKYVSRRTKIVEEGDLKVYLFFCKPTYIFLGFTSHGY